MHRNKYVEACCLDDFLGCICFAAKKNSRKIRQHTSSTPTTMTLFTSPLWAKASAPLRWGFLFAMHLGVTHEANPYPRHHPVRRAVARADARVCELPRLDVLDAERDAAGVSRQLRRAD